MFFLLAYAVAIWSICFIHRRRWPAFVAPLASLPPVAFLTWLDAVFIFNNEDGSPLWLYIVAAAFMGLIVGVGLLIAVQPRTAAEHPCPVCGYDLAGAVGVICSECGSDFTASKPRKTRPRPVAGPTPAAPSSSLASQLASTAPERRERSLASR